VTTAVVDPPPVAPPPAVPRAPVGWAYVIASMMGVLGLWLFVNPANGIAAKRWPWEPPWPLDWTRANATQLFFVLLVVVPLVAAMRPPTRRRGVVVALATGLGLTALATLARGEGAEALYHYGVETYVPPILAMLVAAGLYASRAGGGGRALAPVAAAVLLALLVYPADVDAVRVREGRPSYSAPLVDLTYDLARRARMSDEQRESAAEAGAPTEAATALEVITHPWPVGVVLSLVTAVAGLASLFASRARRVLGWVALAGFVGIATYPMAWLAYETLHASGAGAAGFDRALWLGRRGEAFVRALGGETRYTYAPFLLALFGATTDVLRRR
jgi:hypothetical protein